jgi:outer membrane protein assembly factor BamB
VRVVRRGRVLAFLACGLVCGLAGTALAAIPSWTTYHHDAGRSGIDPDSTSPVAPTQAWQTPALDGSIWGQPLVYGGDVYVATENDTVYALNASTGAIAWQRHLATPVDASQLCGGDINPTVGITSTPVIDPGTGRIYVVADTEENGNAGTIAHEMYALNLSDGTVAVGPVPVDPVNPPSGDAPPDQLQRESLALDAGKVIIGYGGNDSDCGNYHGWLVAVPEAGGSVQQFEVDSGFNDGEGAIWSSGNAPAIDSGGDLWVATGNGNSGSTYAYGDSVLKLGPNMNLLDWWAPSNWQSLDGSDLDLGSSGPLLLPDNLAFEIGKQGEGYLLNASNLGHVGGTPFHTGSVCSGSWGGGIYVNGVIYVACSDGLYALSLNTTARTFAPLPGWSVNSNASGPPIYAGGLVWSASSGVGTDNGTLYGLDPSTGATRFSAHVGGFEHFTTPSAGGGKLFVADGAMVTAFQIANAPGATPTSLALASSANPVPVRKAVTYTATVSPSPDGGTVRFSDNGQGIPGCSAVALSGAQATCTTSYRYANLHRILATYSGDGYYGGSSASLTERVTAPAPVISHLRVRVVKRKLRISFRLSLPARVTAVVAKLVPGRRVHHICRAGARHGRRCTAALRRATLRKSGRRGRNAWRPRMHALAPARYTVTISALTSSGGRSKPHTVVIVVRG